MRKIVNNISELIGNTPLLKLNNFSKKYNLKNNILAKLEYFNPAGSVKDRIAKKMIEDAEKTEKLKNGGTIIEPTSGNTGIGLASLAAAKGYKAVFVMPETMSIERRKLLQIYGAEIVLTEGAKGMPGAIEKANELNKKIENSLVLGQFTNPKNPQAHRETTGPEIWEQSNKEIDIFIAGVGTGGTITGAGEYLKEKNPKIKIIAVEPKDSPMLSKGEKGSHKIQGIGAGFIPQILNTNIYDDIITVTNEDAIIYAKEIAKTEGIFVGISSGAALFAALEISKKEENKNIVVILPDTGERYLSTDLANI